MDEAQVKGIDTEASIKEASCLQALQNEQANNESKLLQDNLMMEEIVVETHSSKHMQEPSIQEDLPAGANLDRSNIDPSVMR